MNKLFLLLFSLFLIFNENINSAEIYKRDSLNVLAEFSLFNEYQKNNDFVNAVSHGWNVINNKPKAFIKYKIFEKMSDVLFFLHDSTSISELEKSKYTDTIIYLYDRAIEYDSDNCSYYFIKKAFVLENWKKAEISEIISAYENAVNKDAKIDDYYKDKLGLLYNNNNNDSNGYKDKALSLYLKFQKNDPKNELWNDRVSQLTKNGSRGFENSEKSWNDNKKDVTTALNYANVCLKNKEYEKAIEPLEFLIEKYPDEIAYVKKIVLCFYKAGLIDKAINGYKKLINLEPDNKQNYVSIAILYKELNQLSLSKEFLQKALNFDPKWDYPVYIEAQLYEQSVRDCGSLDFMDKCVYQYALNKYLTCKNMSGEYSSKSADRIKALSNSVPNKDDYFFRSLKKGTKVKLEGKCYNWIGGYIIVP
ncbi:MAG: tetratricopeptide repeat protein [bacterium]